MELKGSAAPEVSDYCAEVFDEDAAEGPAGTDAAAAPGWCRSDAEVCSPGCGGAWLGRPHRPSGHKSEKESCLLKNKRVYDGTNGRKYKCVRVRTVTPRSTFE